MLNKTCKNVLCRAKYKGREAYCEACIGSVRASKHKDYNKYKRDVELHSFYKTTAWKELRKLKLELNPVCEICWERGFLEYNNLIVHHIKEVKDRPDLALSFTNLQTVCQKCHNQIHFQS